MSNSREAVRIDVRYLIDVYTKNNLAKVIQEKLVGSLHPIEDFITIINDLIGSRMVQDDLLYAKTIGSYSLKSESYWMDMVKKDMINRFGGLAIRSCP